MRPSLLIVVPLRVNLPSANHPIRIGTRREKNSLPKSPKPSIPDDTSATGAAAGAGAGVDEVGLLKKSASSPIHQLSSLTCQRT
jgi:hypothetical protein